METQKKETMFPQNGNVRVPREYPGCWGYQEYNDEIKDARYDSETDARNYKKTKGFIRKWVEQHLDGIRQSH